MKIYVVIAYHTLTGTLSIGEFFCSRKEALEYIHNLSDEDAQHSEHTIHALDLVAYLEFAGDTNSILFSVTENSEVK